MSKSENQLATLYLADDDKAIRNKIMKAKSDSGPAEPGAPMSDAVAGLFQLLRLVSEADVVGKFTADYAAGSIRYGDLKKQLAEDMVRFIAPIREKAEAIQNDEVYLRRVMEQGAAKARASAKQTIEVAKEAIGLKYY
jgi:tryptophanyl-tRNA synthetase